MFLLMIVSGAFRRFGWISEGLGSRGFVEKVLGLMSLLLVSSSPESRGGRDLCFPKPGLRTEGELCSMPPAFLSATPNISLYNRLPTASAFTGNSRKCLIWVMGPSRKSTGYDCNQPMLWFLLSYMTLGKYSWLSEPWCPA